MLNTERDGTVAHQIPEAWCNVADCWVDDKCSGKRFPRAGNLSWADIPALSLAETIITSSSLASLRTETSFNYAEKGLFRVIERINVIQKAAIFRVSGLTRSCLGPPVAGSDPGLLTRLGVHSHSLLVSFQVSLGDAHVEQAVLQT